MTLKHLSMADRVFTWGDRTYVMAIINVTPDSFSGDGLADVGDVVTASLAQARAAIEQGADILDVGGESTRPGAAPVSLREEQARVVPVIAALTETLSIPISIDSYHAETVAAALAAGAHMVNDVWGLRTPDGGWNAALADLVAACDVPIVLMHNRRASATIGAIGGYYAEVAYADLISEVIGELQISVAYAESRGIARERIIIDPGIGFGKTPDQNIELLRNLSELCRLDRPVLLGASRKSFIGQALGAPPDQRDAGTAAITALTVQQGIDIVRVHNVGLNAQAAKMADALSRVRAA